jgi:signal transduction histidine kinase
MLKHSKDDLNFVYHKVMAALQDYMGDKESEVENFRNVFDNIRTGVICFDSARNIVMINRYTRNLLQNPHIKNLSGLERVNPVLANYLIKLKPGTHAYINVEIENVPHELFLFTEEFSNAEDKFRIITLLNLKKEFRREEVHAFDRLMQTIDIGRLVDNKDTSSGLEQYLDLIKNDKPKLTKCKVEELFAESCALFAENMFKNIRCLTRLSNDDLWISADQKLLSRVLINLLINAAESIGDKKDGQIELVAELDLGCDIQIVIRDNGSGIDPRNLDMIFVPFFSTRENHSGMGLPVANKLMDMMNGVIDVKSKPEEGSEFILTFRI